MALYHHVVNSSNINLYSNAFWNFRNGPSQGLCTGDCQTNAVLYENNSKFFDYGIGSINQVNLVMESGPGGNMRAVTVRRDDNYGASLAGFPQDKSALVAAYLRQSV
jgi:glucan 1,3-beta-glucosidase